MLSQNPLLKMLSTVSAPKASSDGFGAIVGGKVDISATGPISLSNWNSFSGSFIVVLPLGRDDKPKCPKSVSPLAPGSFASFARTEAGSPFDAGEGSTRALINARRKPLYKAGV